MANEWEQMGSAPKDRVILLYGRLVGGSAEHPDGMIRVTGYWDEIDGCWALVSTTWEGPFFSPVLWHQMPRGPEADIFGKHRKPDSTELLNEAAPDLLAVVRSFLQADGHDDFEDEWPAARAAVAKALGEHR